MISRKIALLGIVPLFCAGLALAQAPDLKGPPPEMGHHPDRAAMHKEMCEDHQARAAAKLAYVEAKLALTDAQKPLFAKWRQAVLDNAGKQKTVCLANAAKMHDAKTPPAMPSVLEHEQREEAMLQTRLQMLQSTRPTLEAFYNSLTEAQKESFNRMHAHAMQARWHGFGHGGFGHGPGEEGPFSHHPQ